MDSKSILGFSLRIWLIPHHILPPKSPHSPHSIPTILTLAHLFCIRLITGDQLKLSTFSAKFCFINIFWFVYCIDLDWFYLCLMLPVLGADLFAFPLFRLYLDCFSVWPLLGFISLTNYLRLTSCALNSASPLQPWDSVELWLCVSLTSCPWLCYLSRVTLLPVWLCFSAHYI